MQMMSEPMKIDYSTEPMRIEVPVAKTFIQYPVLRNPSLDAFFKEREIASCPASRMASIDEEDAEVMENPSISNGTFECNPIAIKDVDQGTFSGIAKEMEYTVKNTFVDYPAWEPLRNLSLEGFFHERDCRSCPASRVQSVDDTQETVITQGPSAFVVEAPCDVEHSAPRSISLEECLRDIEAKYQDLEFYDNISTKANTEEDTAPSTPEILSDCEDEVRPRAISLTSSLGLWSVGSAAHSSGTCKPCAFLWKDADGCQNGTNCKFCHMCPPGEVKRRKKDKLMMRKVVRQFQQQQTWL
jgi:hypothetical protein